VDEELFVVAEAVEGIEDGEMPGLVGVEGRREDDAVGNRAGENFAGDGVALDATSGGEEREGNKEEKEGEKRRAEDRATGP
jgi:hypothetical protein